MQGSPAVVMRACVSTWTLPPMTPHLCFLLLSSLTVSSQTGLEEVFFSPQDQTAKEGEGVFFQCVSGESSPPASITWLKDGNTVTRGRQIQGEYGGGNQGKTTGTLRLLNVTSQDDGTYVCVAHNAALNISRESRPAKLTVQGVPRPLKLLQGPDNITVAMGTEASMHCAVRGFPVPMVHWFKDGCLLTNCSAAFSLQNNGQLLTFRNVSKEDKGFYHCEASDQRETIKSPPAFLLPAEMDWSFIQQPTDQTARRGENVTVTCRPPHSRPAAQVSWFKDNRLLTPTARVTALPSGDLLLHSVQESDSGSYFCRASNVHLQRFLTSRRASLIVQAPPSVKLWPRGLTVPLGARVVLQCQVSGQPSPSIRWVKRGQSKYTGGKTSFGPRNATLHIQSAQSYDEGVYVCEASNALGHSHSTAMLTVAVSPVIVTIASQVSSSIGAQAVLPCRAVGVLPITYTWTRSRAEMSSLITTTDEGRQTDEDGALRISSVQWSDVGEYFCTAENRAGRHQRRTVLSVTDQPVDRGKQTRLVLSAGTTSKHQPASPSSDAAAEQQAGKTHHPHMQAQHKGALCSSTNCDAATITLSTVSRETVAEQQLLPASPEANQPTTSPTQSLVTQMQPPMLPPPPHLNLQPVVTRGRLLASSDPLSISHEEPTTTRSHIRYQLSVTHLTVTEFQYQVGDKPSTEASSHGPLSSQLTELLFESPSPSERPLNGPQRQSLPAQAASSQSAAPSSSARAELQPSATRTSQVQLPGQTTHQQPSPTQASESYPQRSIIQKFFPKFHLEVPTSQHRPPSTRPPPFSITQSPESQIHSQPSPVPPRTTSATPTSTRFFPVQHRDVLKVQPSVSATRPPDSTSGPSKLDLEVPVVHQVNMSNRLNASQEGQQVQPANDTELTEWLKRNTSQSPMTSNDPRVTQRSPSWLPTLEKHDIPIVVGVGVSLAFIFITVTFYSVVRKNEPAPTSRAAQRNLGVPVRHAERRTAGRTYENRAFEDDECVAVIEQSPNTSDTRARPPGLSLITVQMEPTSESLQEDMQAALDNHSVTVETYPEPILETKIDPSLEEEKGRSLSQPSIQLQCAEDWPGNEGDNHSPCQDALPPPSSLPSCSPSPSPPSRCEEGLRSSLTLQSAEPLAAPIHHSLSISHGTSPLLLSHHVSLGLTTVAVDVHFYPAAAASMAVGPSAHLSSVSSSTSVTAPLFSPPLAHSQENDHSAARLHQCK